MSISTEIEKLIVERVKEICDDSCSAPSLPENIVCTESIGEVIEKMVILHIRTWMLEDKCGMAKTDSEVGQIKRKIDICFKQKRPQYVEAINKMIDAAIKSGKSLQEESIKSYEGYTNE